MKTHYTIGLMFNPSLTEVALIRKNRPKWQEGRLNGIGGHIEDGESPDQCMEREFNEEAIYLPEETGKNKSVDWYCFGEMEGSNEGGLQEESGFKCFLFATKGDIDSIKSRTDELIEKVHVYTINNIRPDLIEHVAWMVMMGAKVLEDGRPVYCSVRYP